MQNNLKRAMDSGLRTLQTADDEQAVILRFCLEGQKVKQKFSVAFVVTMVLVLLAATALAVTAVTGGFRFMDPKDSPQPLSCTILDDTLYMFTNDGLMRWQAADAPPVKLADDQRLFGQGISIDTQLFHTDKLMLLDTDTRTVWQYTNGTFEKVLNLNSVWAQFGRGRVADPVAAGDFLYIRVIAEDAVETDASLWRIDLATGQAEALPIANVTGLLAYRSGELLALQNNALESETLLALDAKSGTVLEPIISMTPLEIKGVAYDAASDAIYAIRNGSLSRWNGSNWLALQVMSVPSSCHFYGTAGGGYIAAGYWGVQFVNLDAEYTEPSLVIRGWVMPFGVEDDFMQSHPGMLLQRENMASFTGADVAQALEAGDTADLFYVRLDATVSQLIRNGLLVPLSQSGVLMEDIRQMLPQVQAAVAPDGTAYALPYDLSVPLWMIQNDTAPTDEPHTVTELLAQDIAWNTEAHTGSMYMADDYNTVPWTRQSYARYALQQMFDEAAAAGGTPDYSAKEFTAFLEMLKDAELSTASQPPHSSVVTAHAFLFLGGREANDARLQLRMINPPVVTASGTPSFPSMLIVYVLNPNSKNLPMALEFLEYVSQNRTPGRQAMLSPDTAEPKLYAYAEPYDDLRALPDSWEVAADALAEYQTDIAPRVSLSLSPYTVNQSAMLDTIMQYLDGALSLTQCTAQLNMLTAAGITD